MNNKTNTEGYYASFGMGETTLTTNWNGNVNTYGNGIWSIPFNRENSLGYSNGSDYTSISTLITNQNNMVRQVKAAVFTVERNEDNKVVSAKFIKEVWVEIKNGSSLDLAVAKELDTDFDPSKIMVREIYSVSF